MLIILDIWFKAKLLIKTKVREIYLTLTQLNWTTRTHTAQIQKSGGSNVHP